MDIIVTIDGEGNYSCTPFYVLFPCSYFFRQTIFETVVVQVNGSDIPELQMYKDCNGEVYFVDDENFGANGGQRTPSLEHLHQMRLQNGVNSVKFTTTLTKQTAIANLFVWPNDVKIVVTDIDGTITRSDVRGHLYNRFGMRWNHSSVSDCFKKVNNLGYKIVYLTSRSITMEAATRKYISSLGLPLGPLLLSPKTLVQAFTSEVITKDSKHGKVLHLNSIVRLFPKCSVCPIVAGFGNNVNDEWAYRTVGVPKSHIFIVNKKSEIICASGRTSYEVVATEICKFFQSLVQDLTSITPPPTGTAH